MSFDVLNSVAKAIAAVKNDTSTSSSGDIKDLAFRILQSLPEDALTWRRWCLDKRKFTKNCCRLRS